MGQSESTELQNNIASRFYQACHDGDIECVQQLLPTLTYEQINRIDPNSGCTPLHVACSNNHQQIVHLLLEHNACNRIIQNKNGKTAFEETLSPDTRSLFNRSQTQDDGNRFVDTSSEQLTFRLVTNSVSSFDRPDNWVKGYFSATEANDSQLMIALSQSKNPLMKQLLHVRTERESKIILFQQLRFNIQLIHREHQRALRLYKQFEQTKSVEPLLTLYSLETPLYYALQANADAYTLILYLHLDKLRKRAFVGDTYRGTIMVSKDLDAYRWAQEQSAVLETRVLQSTSKNADVAKGFAQLRSDDTDRLSVIFHFKFPELCPSAIELCELSYFPPEEEVLVLPFTLFKVTSIEQYDATSERKYEITLENIPVPQSTLWSSSIKIHGRK